MKRIGFFFAIALAFLAAPAFLACQQAEREKAPADTVATHEISQEELTASVPALRALHEVVFPLWHTAYAEKNYALIKELLPKADTLAAGLDAAVLPGILRDKQAAWDEKKAGLKGALQQLHAAADADNRDEMLKQVEAFHAWYEQLVRTIRPLVKELEAYHQELYKLYHYYAPAYDLERIRAASAALVERIPALREAQLPKRLADRQADFQAAVGRLEEETKQLAEAVKGDSKEKMLATVEKVHTAYQKVEHLFD